MEIWLRVARTLVWEPDLSPERELRNQGKGAGWPDSPASWTLLTFYFISARKAKMGRRVQQQSLALRNI